MRHVSFGGQTIEMSERDFLALVEGSVDAVREFARYLCRRHTLGLADVAGQSTFIIQRGLEELRALVSQIDDEALRGLVESFYAEARGMVELDDRVLAEVARYVGLPPPQDRGDREELQRRLQKYDEVGSVWTSEPQFQQLAHETQRAFGAIDRIRRRIDARLAHLRAAISSQAAETPGPGAAGEEVSQPRGRGEPGEDERAPLQEALGLQDLVDHVELADQWAEDLTDEAGMGQGPPWSSPLLDRAEASGRAIGGQEAHPQEASTEVRLTDSLVERISARMGASGHPYRVFVGLKSIDTGCVAWPLPRESEPVPDLISEYNALLARYQAIWSEAGLDAAFARAISGRSNIPWEEWKETGLQLVDGSERRSELRSILEQMRALTAHCQVTMVEGMPVVDLTDLLPDDPRQSVNPLPWDVRELLAGEPAIAYRNGASWTSVGFATASLLVVAPAHDQYEALRIERTDAVNYGLQTEDVIARLRELDGEFGIDIVGATSTAVEFLLKRIPKGEEASRLAKWLLEFCPDLYEAPERFDRAPVSLWWD